MIDKLLNIFKKNDGSNIKNLYENVIEKNPLLTINSLKIMERKALLEKVIKTENINYFYFLKENDFSFSFKGFPDILNELLQMSFYFKDWEIINSELIKNNNIKNIAKIDENVIQNLLHYQEFDKVKWLIEKGFPEKNINPKNAMQAAVGNLNAKEIEQIILLDINKSGQYPGIVQIFSTHLYYLSESRTTYLQKSKFALRVSDCLDILEKYNLMSDSLKNEVCITLSCIQDTPFEFLEELYKKYNPDFSKIDMDLLNMFFEPEDYMCNEKGKIYDLLKKHKFNMDKIDPHNAIIKAIENNDRTLLDKMLIDFKDKIGKLNIIEKAFDYNKISLGLYLVNKKREENKNSVNIQDFLCFTNSLTDDNFKDDTEINKILKTINKYFPEFLDNRINFVHSKKTKNIRESFSFSGMALFYNENIFDKYIKNKFKDISNTEKTKIISSLFIDMYPFITKHKNPSDYYEKILTTNLITLENKISGVQYMDQLGMGQVFGNVQDKENKIKTLLNNLISVKEKNEIEKILPNKDSVPQSKKRL